MKKVVLSAAALIFAVMSYAQTPTPPQQAQVVAPLPGAAAGANTGESIQNGNSNKVKVQQAGVSNSAKTVQNDGTGSGDNRAWITQSGWFVGQNNAAEMNQSGSNNQSRSIQFGDDNSALTNQGQTDASSEGNRARIEQRGLYYFEGDNNSAQIDQDGKFNKATTLQYDENNNALTDQDGDFNKSKIVQNSAWGGSGHNADVKQAGEDNESWVSQTGQSTNNAIALQIGEGNKSLQYQTNSGYGNAANDALVTQGDGIIGTDLNGSIFFGGLVGVDSAIQAGGSNGPGSDNGIAFQFQNGSGNDAEIHQFGSDATSSNYAQQNQWGEGNDAYIVQNAYGTSFGGNNYANQLQSGDSNEAGVGQNGIDHKAYQRQFGSNNQALSTQITKGNLVNTYQAGNNNVAHTAQRGKFNQALVVQKGGHSYSVSQNLGLAPGSMAGGNNIADILQLGPGGNFHTDGEDCEFPDQLDPTRNYHVQGFNIDEVCPDC